MGLTACTEPLCLYEGALYLYLPLLRKRFVNGRYFAALLDWFGYTVKIAEAYGPIGYQRLEISDTAAMIDRWSCVSPTGRCVYIHLTHC